jgi:hypothetical protein
VSRERSRSNDLQVTPPFNVLPMAVRTSRADGIARTGDAFDAASARGARRSWKARLGIAFGPLLTSKETAALTLETFQMTARRKRRLGHGFGLRPG